MVKSVLSVNHQGLREWLLQRVTAIVMAFYFAGLFAYFLMHPDLSFAEWHHLFSGVGMKVATLLCVASVLIHAWIGMWTIMTDYVNIFAIRFILYVGILLLLVACFFWALLILWGI